MASRQRSGSEGQRLLRVGENVRHALAQILSRDQIRDEDLTGVSVTVAEVRVSPDLRHASVFVMPLAGASAERVTAALNRNSGFIRGQMSRLVTMKYMPKLKFILDESFDEATHIDTLLRDPRVQQDLDSPDSHNE